MTWRSRTIGEGYHPLAALYRRAAVLPTIEGMLREDRLKVKGLVEPGPDPGRVRRGDASTLILDS